MTGGIPCIETKEQAAHALESFCKHVASGKPQFSWYIDDDIVRCCDQTLLNTIKAKPDLFDTFLKEKAHRDAYKIWWEKGQNMVEGTVKGSYSPQVYHTMMRNLFRRFGWWESSNDVEKEEVSSQQFTEVCGKSKDLVNGS